MGCIQSWFKDEDDDNRRQFQNDVSEPQDYLVHRVEHDVSVPRGFDDRQLHNEIPKTQQDYNVSQIRDAAFEYQNYDESYAAVVELRYQEVMRQIEDAASQASCCEARHVPAPAPEPLNYDEAIDDTMRALQLSYELSTEQDCKERHQLHLQLRQLGYAAAVKKLQIQYDVSELPGYEAQARQSQIKVESPRHVATQIQNGLPEPPRYNAQEACQFDYKVEQPPGYEERKEYSVPSTPSSEPPDYEAHLIRNGVTELQCQGQYDTLSEVWSYDTVRRLPVPCKQVPVPEPLDEVVVHQIQNGGIPALFSNKYPENIYELVIKLAGSLETLLETKFEATGKGLHEKVTSVEAKLNPGLVKNLRFLASVRNQLVHHEEVPNQPKTERYILGYERAKEDLEDILNGGTGQRSQPKPKPPRSKRGGRSKRGRSRSATPSRIRY